MRVGSRGEFLKQITLIERAWEDVQGTKQFQGGKT